jgi:predicted dehydrogenase
MTQKSKVLIFGYGSVGKKYAQYFSNKNFDILVFDPFIRIKNSNLKMFKSYNQLSKFINQIDFAIICSLAEDHYPNFCVASNLNIKNILMEKPLTNNFDELSKIKKIIKKKKLIFTQITLGNFIT